VQRDGDDDDDDDDDAYVRRASPLADTRSIWFSCCCSALRTKVYANSLFIRFRTISMVIVDRNINIIFENWLISFVKIKYHIS
jgi:hypothetical protein